MGIQVAIVGATGRIGRHVCEIIECAPDLGIYARLDSRSDLAEIAGADVVCDVTRPGVSPTVVRAALAAGIPVVVGTSGWSAAAIAEVAAGDPAVGVLFVPNLALGSVLATAFAVLAAPYFDAVEIVEAHHARKADSPSGTAVRTAERIAAARATPLDPAHPEQPARGATLGGIPIHALRVPGVQGEQTVVLGALGETLRLTHTVTSSEAYTAGILLALRSVRGLRGVHVGLEQVLPGDLGALTRGGTHTPSGAPEPPG